MKKSVVILIGIIYIASIALVSFLGLKPKDYNESVYVNEIRITNEDVKYDDLGNKYVTIFPDADGVRQYVIYYTVGPENASDKGINISYDDSKSYVTVENTEPGVIVVTFSERGAVTIEITAQDGSTASDKIEIAALA